MATTAEVLVKARYDGGDVAKGLGQTAQAAKQAESSFDQLKKAAGQLAIGAAVGKFFGDAISAASDLEQAVGGTDAVFKESAQAIHDWAKDTGDDFRVPAVEAERFATAMGATLQRVGMSTDESISKTKELAQVGADLAAQYGGSTVAALEAVNAAIAKGEFERLEAFNISIKQADVSAEMAKIAGGADKITAANRPAIETQARMNLLMQQAGPAMGAAAREAETFAGRQEAFNEQWENFLAAVGGPLLGVLGDLLDGLSNFLPVIQPIITGVAALVSAVLGLPGPLLAAVAGLTAWQMLGGLTGIVNGFRVAIEFLTASISKLSKITLVGFALTAIITAFEVMSNVMDSNSDIVDENAEMWERWKGTLSGTEITAATRAMVTNDLTAKGMLGTYRELGVNTEAYVDAVLGVEGAQADVEASVRSATDALFAQGGAFADVDEAIKGAGVSYQQVLDAAASGNWTEITNKVRSWAEEQERAGRGAGFAATTMQALEAAIASGGSSASSLSSVMAALGVDIEALGVGGGAAVDALRDLGTAEGDAAANALELEAAQKTLKTAIQLVKDAASETQGAKFLEDIERDADDAKNALDLLSASMDEISKKSELTTDPTLSWGEGFRKIADAAKVAEGEVGLSKDALASWNVAALASTEVGTKTAKAVLDQADNYQELISATYSQARATMSSAEAAKVASDAATSARGEFIAFATDSAAGLGLTAEQANELANQVGILDATQLDPLVWEMIAEDEQLRGVIADLTSKGVDPLTVKILGDDATTPVVENIISYVDSTGATIKVDANTGKVVSDVAAAAAPGAMPTATVPVQAETSFFQTGINNLVGLVSKIFPPKIPVSADTAPATAAIGAVSAGSYPATIVLNGNSVPVNNVIRAVIGGSYPATITLNGNSVPVNNTIRAVIGGSYPATITLNGNQVPVNNVIRAVIGGSYPATITLNGNAGPVNSVIRSVIGGSYTATVTVVANTAPFYAAYNALPTSRAVTLTQTVVTVAAPAPAAATLAAPAMMSMAAEPSLAAVPMAGMVTRRAAPTAQATTPATPVSNVTINVTGAVDPDSTARQIESLLRRRDRRRSTVIVRRPGPTL